MFPQFFVFIDQDEQTPQQLGAIKNLLDLGYTPFVDSVHGNQESWFKTNLVKCDHNLYYFNGSSVNGEKYDEDKPFTKPDLLVAFSEGINLSLQAWKEMDKLMARINVLNLHKVDIETALEMFERPVKQTASPPKAEDPPVEYSTAYKYRQSNVGDVKFYEIIKPYVEVPYVTMVEDDESFPFDKFTNWFKCTSFGVANSDVAFIHQLWKYYDGSGEKLDLEKMFEERVQRVLDGGKEPLVWRNTLENVVDIYTSALESAEGGKRKKEEGEMMNKRKN